MNMKLRSIVISAMVGAVYAALTLLVPALSFGAIQFRFSEALCVLPYFMPQTAWGLAIGCAFANLFGGFGWMDIVFGSLATLAAGLIAARTKHKWLVPLPAVLINAVVVGAVIAYSVAGTSAAFWGVFGWNMVTVGVGQLGACYGLGIPLIYGLPKIQPLRKYFSHS